MLCMAYTYHMVRFSHLLPAYRQAGTIELLSNMDPEAEDFPPDLLR